MPRYIDADAIHYVEIGKGVEIALASDIDKIPTVSLDEVRGVGKWTSVEERLPDVAEKVLTYNGDFVSENWLCTVASKVGRINVWAYSEGFVTHWMPLPAPPKEDAK